MVQGQSSSFPLIDRNPQTFVPSIFDATASDYQTATIKIYGQADASSGVVLPIVSWPKLWPVERVGNDRVRPYRKLW
jgi:predicted acyl esterase